MAHIDDYWKLRATGKFGKKAPKPAYGEVMPRPGRERYQGKEFNVTIGAPTREVLDQMVEGLHTYAGEHGLEDFEVLSRRPDPDGGWECTLRAHNWNPISWVKEKLRKEPKEEPKKWKVKPTPEELREEDRKLLGTLSDRERQFYEEAEKAKAEAARLDELRRQEEARRRTYEKAEAEEEQLVERLIQVPRWNSSTQSWEVVTMKVKVPKEQVKLEKEKIRREIEELEMEREFAPTEKELLRAQAEAKLGELRRQREFAPLQTELEKAQTKEQIEFIKELRRQRGLPARLAKGVGGLAAGVAQAGTLGIAGVAQSIQPGKAGPQRAARMLAPKVPMELYGVKPPSPRFGRPPGIGGLEHLRGAVLPRTVRPTPGVRPVVTPGRPVAPDVTSIRRRVEGIRLRKFRLF